VKKPKPVAKAAAHHHPAHPKKAAKPAHVSAAVRKARHDAALKASRTRAKNAAKAKRHTRRKLALGSAVACCSAEALAASARLAGYQVSDADVLELYWRTARDPDEGATILATLEAAQEFGLAGLRPERWRHLSCRCGEPAETLHHLGECAAGHGQIAHDLTPAHIIHAAQRSQIVIGATLPGGPHAVTLDPSGAVWSWGELYRPTGPGLIEEAWLVDWEAS
jgi:hypothetical protein